MLRLFCRDSIIAIRGYDFQEGHVKPHKVRYYLERRDPDFAEKMAEVLCVYRQGAW